MRTLIVGVLAVASVWGQGMIFPRRPYYPQIRTYLGLTDEQVAKMQRQNDDFAQWAAGRQSRMFEVQGEIAVETAKSLIAARRAARVTN